METLDVYTIENGMEKVEIHDVCKVPCLPRLSVFDSNLRLMYVLCFN